MTIDPGSVDGPPTSDDPADGQTEGAAIDSDLDEAAFTERGENAETAAFTGDGAYSGGGFAGGDSAGSAFAGGEVDGRP